MKRVKGIKDRLRDFRKKWSFFSWEKNTMANIGDYINCLNSIVAEKIREIVECEEQVQKIKRVIRIRRIRAIFGLFSY